MTQSLNPPETWIAYSDGASRGNPGLASGGVFIIAPDGQELKFKQFFEIKTNNQAEYMAMLLALEELAKLNAKNILIRADSEFMIKQMRGEYKVKNEGIKELYQQARVLLKNFDSVKFEHVRREFNKKADQLANMAIDEHLL